MRKQKGAIAMLLAITLILAVGTPLLLRMIDSRSMKAAWTAETHQKLRTIDDAMVAFVISKRRLPCPADGAVPKGAVGAGAEARNPVTGDCTAAQVRGVVPWLALGLTEADATDAWGGRLTYRVHTGPTGLVQDGAMDASFCDPVGTNPALGIGAGNNIAACLNTCISPTPNPNLCNAPATFLANRGILVRNAAAVSIRDPAIGTGAAYIVVSHGPEGGGAFDGNGQMAGNAVPVGGNGEIRNINNQVVPANGFFYDEAIRTGIDAGADHFDDLMSFPSMADLLNKTGLGARTH